MLGIAAATVRVTLKSAQDKLRAAGSNFWEVQP